MAQPLRIAGHPVHPALVHFPVALWSISTLWDGLGAATGNPVWWQMGFWSVVAGLAFSVPAAVAGFIDYAALPRRHPATDIAVRHMLTMLSAASVYLINVAVRGSSAAPVGWNSIAVLVLSLLGLALVAAGGWLGGQLVYHYGIGRADVAAHDGQSGSDDSSHGQ